MNEKLLVPLIVAIVIGAGSILYSNTLTTVRLAENIIQHSIAIEKIGQSIEKVMLGNFTKDDAMKLQERQRLLEGRVITLESNSKDANK